MRGTARPQMQAPLGYNRAPPETIMPIYEYRCDACGFQKEFLQKLSAAPLKTCPACGQDAFAKMLSAAGFQLKGGGWYATDFKGGASAKPDKAVKPDNPPPCQGGTGSCACSGS